MTPDPEEFGFDPTSVKTVVVRTHPPPARALHDRIAQQAQPLPSCPEAVRRPVEIGLRAKTR
jgi:hypothetical protein